jgi:glyoxylase I family protein
MASARPMQVNRIGAIVFYVKDLDRTDRFYREVLGLETVIRTGKHSPDEPEERFIYAKAGSTSLIFFERAANVGTTPIVVFGLDGGIDDFFDQLVAHKVEIVLPVSPAPGGWTTDFRDPDGHVLSFYQTETAPRRM